MNINIGTHKNKELELLTKKIEIYLKNILSNIDLKSKWEKNDALNYEIKKSFTRGLIRYSEHTNELVDLIKNDFKSKFPNKKNIEWISLPYPMIHLSYDYSEDGGFHNDGYQEDFYTCWLPVTNYKYDALSIYRLQNKIIDKFSSLIIKIGVPKFLQDRIKASQGNAFYWNAKRVHKGNLNISNQISVAIQMKITSKIYELEQTRNFNKSQNINFKSQFLNYDNMQINENYKLYNKIIKFILENIERYEEFYIIKQVSNMLDTKSMPFSFALSVLSQRIITNRKIFHIKNNEKFVNILDLISLFVGSANLISLKRLIKKNYMNSDLLDFLKNNDVFKAIPFGTFQFLSITENSKNFKINNNFSY